MSKITNRYGTLALVTGASTGIGKELARELAKGGMDLILVARSVDKLTALAEDLRQSTGVEVQVQFGDLASAEGIGALLEAVGDRQVDLLVNNAGAASPGAFLGSDPQAQTRHLFLNVEAPLQLTHHFANKMAARGRGGVLFVGSTIGYGTTPWMAHYAGTKNFIHAFADGLRGELAPLGVDVALLAPGPTRTSMVQMEGMEMEKLPMFWMEADEVAREGIKALLANESRIAGFANRVMTVAMARLLPRSWAAKLFGNMMGSVMDDHLKQSAQNLPAGVTS